MRKLTVLIWGSALIVLISFPLKAQEHKHEEHRHEQNREQDTDRNLWMMWQMPEHVMNATGVKPGMVIGDIGAGQGYFSNRLAKRVGESGHVYANDIVKSMLDIIEETCRRENITNITTILGKQDDPLLPEGKLDMALMVNVIHLLENPVLFLKKVKPCLKEDGVFVIIQWDSKKLQIEAPIPNLPEDETFSLDAVLRPVYQAGYKVVRIKQFLPLQNIFVCKPVN